MDGERLCLINGMSFAALAPSPGFKADFVIFLNFLISAETERLFFEYGSVWHGSVFPAIYGTCVSH